MANPLDPNAVERAAAWARERHGRRVDGWQSFGLLADAATRAAELERELAELKRIRLASIKQSADTVESLQLEVRTLRTENERLNARVFAAEQNTLNAQQEADALRRRLRPTV